MRRTVATIVCTIDSSTPSRAASGQASECACLLRRYTTDCKPLDKPQTLPTALPLPHFINTNALFLRQLEFFAGIAKSEFRADFQSQWRRLRRVVRCLYRLTASPLRRILSMLSGWQVEYSSSFWSRSTPSSSQNSGKGASERRLFFPDGGLKPPVREVSYKLKARRPPAFTQGMNCLPPSIRGTSPFVTDTGSLFLGLIPALWFRLVFVQSARREQAQIRVAVVLIGSP